MPTVARLLADLAALTGVAEPDDRVLHALGDAGGRLLATRRAARACEEGIPAMFGSVRRASLRAWDDATTTWDAWDTTSGRRVLLCVARPGAGPGAGPEVRARFEAATGLRICMDGGLHLRSDPIECMLGDLLPLDDACDLAWGARVLGGVLESLTTLGTHHGDVAPEWIARSGGRWSLMWLGAPGPDSPADLLAVGRLALDLDPSGELASLMGGDLESPPPSASDALRLLVGGLGTRLADLHNQLVLRERSMVRSRRKARLSRALARLVRAAPPPVARGCLHPGGPGLATWIVSDGSTIRAGLAADPLGVLPLVWHDGTLDPGLARAALRAWAGRPRQPAFEDDAAVGRLLRWIAGMARLRTDVRLLARP